MARVAWDLWTTTAEVVVDSSDERAVDAAVAAVREVTDAVEAACSRFRPDSELMARRAELESGAGAEVSPMLAELVQVALDAARSTDGDVDPTLGSRMQELGYDASRGGAEPDGTEARRASWKDVTLEGRFLRVPAGVILDLGATAKAFAADRGAAAAAERAGVGVMVSLGGDIATAGPTADGVWQILVRDLDDDPEEQIGLASGWSIATSSTSRRRWERDGRPMHHILDPRWGVPAAPVWRSVTAVTPTCVAANTITTACIVRGAEAVQFLADRYANVPARLVSARGDVIRVGGWPAERA
ncbi:FAD:protein FMN transferase [Curtobacterium ammoniigenes]|uniref:FAD:protein FMN transferase n=1 Tax=Curtobacterium ammoniigenes TaxID=395387 RepID=UPI00082B1A46|nr:FAD:protein FMN transferase [Curtobacterium ammoniigenes]